MLHHNNIYNGLNANVMACRVNYVNSLTANAMTSRTNKREQYCV